MAGDLQKAKLDAAIRRLQRWILGLAVAGTIVAAGVFGLRAAGGFLLGAIAAWINLRLIERAVDRIGRLAVGGNAHALKPGRKGVLLFIQFTGLTLGGFVILMLSGFQVIAALCGFLVSPAAVMLEIVYELVTYEHS